MSNIHRLRLSSLAAGVCLALVLRSGGACAYGFLSIQLLSVWAVAVYRYCANYMHRSKPEAYTEHNSVFLAESTASTAPRQYILREPTVVYYGTLSVALGVSDALLAVMPHTSADNYVLLALAISMSGGMTRLLGFSSMVYCLVLRPLPLAHEMIRPLSFALPMLCCNMSLPRVHRMLRFVACAVTALLYSPGSCTSMLRAIPPALFACSCIMSLGANLPFTFIIAGTFA